MNFPDFSLNGQIALVTGARRGIGKAIALAFANAGADVAVCDLVAEDGALEITGNEIRKLCRRALTIKADTSLETDIDLMVKQVTAEFGTIDILVNNAGINIPGPLLEITSENWDKLMSVNLKGYFLMSKSVGRIMISNKRGNIISMSSRFAFRTEPNLALYSISKAGVAMLTKSIAKELGVYGVRANAIAPGLVKTDFNKRFWEDEKFMKYYLPLVPLGRAAEISDVLGAALYLASPASSYVNGEVILVDGGNVC